MGPEKHSRDRSLRPDRHYDSRNRVMENICEYCVSKYVGQVRQLVREVENRSRVHSMSAYLNARSNHHYNCHSESEVHRYGLEHLRVLDVSERESDGKRSEDDKSDEVRVDCTVPVKPPAAWLSSGDERDALLKTLCSANVLQTHSTIHVDYDDHDDSSPQTLASEAFDDSSVLKLLSDVVRTSLDRSICGIVPLTNFFRWVVSTRVGGSSSLSVVGVRACCCCAFYDVLGADVRNERSDYKDNNREHRA